MKKARIAIVGLGMAVVPHAKSLIELSDRVEVAYAFSPSPARRAKFAETFAFPQCQSMEAVLMTLDRCGCRAHAGEHAPRPREALAPWPENTCWSRSRSRLPPPGLRKWLPIAAPPASRSVSSCSIATSPQ